MTTAFPECDWLTLRQDGFHLTVTLNRPDARNAMSAAMALELAAVFAALSGRDDIAAIVLRGAGKHFCAGGDLKDMTDAIDPPAPGAPDVLYEVNRRFGDLLTAVDAAPQAVIAVVQGAARGGGFGLICAADVVIAQSDSTYAMPETGFGLPGAQIIPFVTTRLGAHYARRLIVTGDAVDGVEMHRAGLVTHLCDGEAQAETALRTVLEQIKGRSPTAVAQSKALVAQVGKVPLSLLLDEGGRMVADGTRDGDGREGLDAFFAKRKPKWSEREG
ncbi:MAG: enoyl-CoA hydratase/isomerase family protein [Proteobacteria bacterium]|nr:enoyl-CoA hydratase/isomerase family protein [Pseudomonadota bacterium]MDA1060078.1 enoyl-CoA hydratase/isomerase family protein [Pseudomonadota bacterium]